MITRKGIRFIVFIFMCCLFFSESRIVMAEFSMEKEEIVLFTDDFESGELGMWGSNDNATVSVVNEDSNSGEYCLKITDRKVTSSGVKVEVGNMLRNDYLLDVLAYAKYNEGVGKKKIQVTLAYAGGYYVLGSAELIRGEWGEIRVSRVVPDNIDLSDAKLYFETPWVAEPTKEQDFMDIYIDDIRVALQPFSNISSYPSLKEIYREEFLVGVAASDEVLRTNIYSNLIQEQFNSITMGNEMKPDYILREAESRSNLETYRESAALNFDTYKTGMEYAKNHGIKMRGHTLIWHEQTPNWFFYEDYDIAGDLASRELMLKRMEHYIKGVIEWTETNYPGVIYAWDVVNEAAADPWGENADNFMRQEGSLWYQTIGEDFVEKAFEFARKYTKQYAQNHKISLIYNDYNEYFSTKRDRIIKLIKPIKDAGNIDGIGMQSHIDTKLPLEGDNGYMTAIRKFHDELGLEIQITELDIAIAQGHTMEEQGIYFQEFMEALLKEKMSGANITSLTLWGISDGLSWHPESYCLVFNDDLSRKSAFEGLVNAVGKSGEVIGKIREIGVVTIEEGSKIEDARKAYDALSETQKKWVINYNILAEAELKYIELKKEAEIAYQASSAVVEEINKIGTVTLKEDSMLQIKRAREAYDILTEAQKKLVKNYSVLLEAEKIYQELLEISQAKKTISIKNVNIQEIPVQTYSGKSIKPVLKMTYNGKKLFNKKDYVLEYKNNKKIGQASVTITGIGNYKDSVTKKFRIMVRKDKVYSIGNYNYKITNANITGKGTVMVIGVKNKKIESIKVKDTVKIGGKVFRVCAIGKAAFEGCKKLTRVSIGKNIESIGKNAFFQCRKLKKIVINSLSLKSIKENAIKGISQKACIYCPKKKKVKYMKLFKTSTGYKRVMRVEAL